MQCAGDTANVLRQACAALVGESALSGWLRLTPSGRVLDANAALRARLGLAAGVAVDLAELVAVGDLPRLLPRLRAGGDGGETFLVNFVDARQLPFTFTCRLWSDGEDRLLLGEPTEVWDQRLGRELLMLNNEMALLARDSAREQRAASAALIDLRDSHWHIRKLAECLTICMYCGKARLPDGSWETLARYLTQVTDFLSHGLCADCGDAAQRALEELGPCPTAD